MRHDLNSGLMSMLADVNPSAITGTPSYVGVLEISWQLVATAICLFIIATGLSAAAVFFLAKSQKSPTSFVQSLGLGSLASGATAGLGTKIAGFPFNLTWAQAALFSAACFVFMFLFWCGLLVLWFYLKIVRPLEHRFGKPLGIRVWVEAFSGIEPLRNWLARTVRSVEADEVWDEFACAYHEVSTILDGLPAGSGLQTQFAAIGEDAHEDSIRLLRATLEKAILVLGSRLSRTTLNFTIWRVHQDGDHLEHLLSIPVEPSHEAGHGTKSSLDIWADPMSRCEPGSLAAGAMLRSRYVTLTPHELRSLPQRNLGKKYDAVGAMPVPCDRGQGPPWAAVCVENREGGLPLESNSMRLLLGGIARVVHATAPLLFVEDIEGTRIRREFPLAEELAAQIAPPSGSGTKVVGNEKESLAVQEIDKKPSNSAAYSGGSHAPCDNLNGAVSPEGSLQSRTNHKGSAPNM